MHSIGSVVRCPPWATGRPGEPVDRSCRITPQHATDHPVVRSIDHLPTTHEPDAAAAAERTPGDTDCAHERCATVTRSVVAEGAVPSRRGSDRGKADTLDRVRENDRRLRTALEEIIVETGWGSVTFTGVAKRAGLTVGAVYGRAESPAELGNDLWSHSTGTFLHESLDQLLTAVASGDPKEVQRFAAAWDEQQTSDSVLVELLIASLFDDELAEGVGVSASDLLSTHCVPDNLRAAHRAAVATLVTSFFLGWALALRSTGTLPPLTRAQTEVLASYWSAAPADIDRSDVLPLAFVRDTGDTDPDVRHLDRSVSEVLGRVGYRRCTIARIARAAGVTKGAISTHYDSKARFIAAAAGRTLLTPLEVWSQYEPVVEGRGPLTARALFLADFLRPEHRRAWLVNLELAHVALWVPELAAFAAPPDTLQHTHLGVMLVASLVTGLDQLPFAGPFGAGSAT